MFDKYRMSRLAISIARLESEAGQMANAVTMSESIPLHYVDKLVKKKGDIAALKKRLEILIEEQSNG